jgi:hypothetical protein
MITDSVERQAMSVADTCLSLGVKRLKREAFFFHLFVMIIRHEGDVRFYRK